jgi:hypothetical protein
MYEILETMLRQLFVVNECPYITSIISLPASVLAEVLTVAQLVKKFSASYRIRNVINVLSIASYFICNDPADSIHSGTIFYRYY